MPESASVIAAATTLVEWAHQRRRRWTDEPLHVELPAKPVETREVQQIHEVLEVPEAVEVVEVPEVFEIPEVDHLLDAPVFFDAQPVTQDVPSLPQFAEALPLPEDPDVPVADYPELFETTNFEPPPLAVDTRSLFGSTEIHAVSTEPDLHVDSHHRTLTGLGTGVVGVLRLCGSHALTVGRFALKGVGKVGDGAVAALEGVGPWSDAALWCLTRGAALVSTASVLMLLTMHRADLFSRWDRLSETVAAAAAATRPQPPPPIVFPDGTGRIIVTSSDDHPQVVIDGKAHGSAPVTLFLPAGAHRLLVRGPKGSVERTVHVEAAETAELNEEIYPGWVAVSSAVDLAFSENGRTLKRDERGWAILTPGPHDIRLDNDLLGIHESRHVVVTPGDATRISLAPPASTLSITTSESAEVWVDGTSLGEAPVVDAPMKLGMHDVRVRSASHERWVRVRVTTQPAELKVDLSGE